MRILIVNSNTTEAVTAGLLDAARRLCPPGVEVVATTAPCGVAAIERPEHLPQAALGTLRGFEANATGADAGIVACFSDPGLAEVRAAMPFPVVGLAEAACLVAAEGGRRFAVVLLGHAMRDVLCGLIEEYGCADRLAAIECLSVGVLEFGRNPDTHMGELHEAVRRCVDAGAEVVVLGGAVTAGLGEALSKISPVPVLDGLECALRMAIRRAGA
ncbi:aspartate/glutamate racemase family protein [Pseudazoarcus pumilus]|uniref:Asp/Glu/hydantoin racemase n=1 Tax=Pseudazoarcus pumilus TaxID=2067960 RepID=A0A2I6S3B9_9RHOO|nr:aspartate/glutamate racemase family protein [Pseudazoarcus pumilus]AUN93756.1 Asp/Glu/hydantoin racemase [Pseudazoarcus pumilus]